MKQIYNPYLPSCEYIPDGEPHVFEGRLYLYGSHDRFDSSGFCLNDYVCWSAPVEDLKKWRYEGVIFRKDQDPVNQNIPADAPPQFLVYGIQPKKPSDLNPRGVHAMWAPDVTRGPDGRYYLYYCLDFLPEIGVAVCDTPAGKYEYLGRVRHMDSMALGSRPGDLIQFDPGVFVDDDGSIFLYSGNAPIRLEDEDGTHHSQVMRLQPDMLTLAEEPRPLLPSLGESAGSGFEGHEFFEASSIRKIGKAYYLVYSSVQSHELCYAVSDRPDSGYRFGGTLVDIGDVFLDGRKESEAINALGNTHGGIENCGGRWYVFYHRQTNRTNFSRQGCAEELVLAPDGSFAQAEVTSCGLNGGPLAGNGIYPACICSRLTGKKGAVMSLPKIMGTDYPYLTQDEDDLWPEDRAMAEDSLCPVQYIANLQDGSVAGYKVFRFSSLREIRMELRGEWEGSVQICIDPGDSSAAELPLCHTSNDWQYVCVSANIPDGVHALYFRFSGTGKLDFRRFELQS